MIKWIRRVWTKRARLREARLALNAAELAELQAAVQHNSIQRRNVGRPLYTYYFSLISAAKRLRREHLWREEMVNRVHKIEQERWWRPKGQ